MTKHYWTINGKPITCEIEYRYAGLCPPFPERYKASRMAASNSGFTPTGLSLLSRAYRHVGAIILTGRPEGWRRPIQLGKQLRRLHDLKGRR